MQYDRTRTPVKEPMDKAGIGSDEIPVTPLRPEIRDKSCKFGYSHGTSDPEKRQQKTSGTVVRNAHVRVRNGSRVGLHWSARGDVGCWSSLIYLYPLYVIYMNLSTTESSLRSTLYEAGNAWYDQPQRFGSHPPSWQVHL